MAEELWEQVAYGDHCVHGTAIGTPGGADLMCGFCEMGLTRWVEDPGYELWVLFYWQDEQGAHESPLKLKPAWRESDLFDNALLRRVYVVMRQAQRHFERTDLGFEATFEVRRSDHGYWDE